MSQICLQQPSALGGEVLHCHSAPPSAELRDYVPLIQRGLGLEAQGRFSDAEKQFLMVLRRSAGTDLAARTRALHIEWILCELFLCPGNVDLAKAERHATRMRDVAASAGALSMVAMADRELSLVAARRRGERACG